MVYAVVVAVVVLGILHCLVGLVSVCVGVASSIQAEVWLAHTVSPIWSGGFFIITGILGFASAKRKTAYMIMCFTAFSIVSLMTSIVSIQLLRLGLVNHTTDGNTYQKEEKDILILVALGDAGTEILICLVSSIVSCRMARAAKNELFQKRAGCFHVQGAQDPGGPGDDGADDGGPPVWGPNQHGDVHVPTDVRPRGAQSNLAVMGDEGEWLDLSGRPEGGVGGEDVTSTHEEVTSTQTVHIDAVQVHGSERKGGGNRASPREDEGCAGGGVGSVKQITIRDTSSPA